MALCFRFKGSLSACHSGPFPPPDTRARQASSFSPPKVPALAHSTSQLAIKNCSNCSNCSNFEGKSFGGKSWGPLRKHTKSRNHCSQDVQNTLTHIPQFWTEIAGPSLLCLEHFLGKVTGLRVKREREASARERERERPAVSGDEVATRNGEKDFYISYRATPHST